MGAQVGLYVLGGALVRSLSGQHAHLGLEGCACWPWAAWSPPRSAGCPGGWSPGRRRCTNAISNILFENLVTRWWDPATRTQGHARVMQADIAAGVVALGGASPWTACCPCWWPAARCNSSPWLRAYQQAHLPEDPGLRLPLTGILISVEACSYLRGALCIALSDDQMSRLALLTTLPLALLPLAGAGWAALKHRRLARATPALQD